MAYDKKLSPEENIVRIFETGVGFINKGSIGSIISATTQTFLGLGIFAYASNLIVDSTQPYHIAIASGMLISSSMMAIINADVISQNLYSRKTFNKDFSSMSLKDKMSYIGGYIPYIHKMKYTDWLSDIASLICFSLMCMLYTSDTINDFSNNSLILSIMYLFAVCINILVVIQATKTLAIYSYTHNAWKIYLKINNQSMT